MSIRYRIIDTQQGLMAMVTTDVGLRRVYLPCGRRSEIKRAVAEDFPDAIEDERLLGKLTGDLRRFFDGEPVEFDVRLDWSGAAPFDVDVWRTCREIRYGETASYRDLAERLGRPGAARAVGTSMSRNPFAIVVPCHRVVKSDGSLGGYSGPGGVAFKRRLLEMEEAALPALA